MSLSVTSWPQAFDLRIAHESAAGTSVNSNCLGSNGIIKQVRVDNTQGDQDVFIKIKDALSAANSEEADWMFRVKSGQDRDYLLRKCWLFLSRPYLLGHDRSS
jgi:hypothetical protein